MKQKLFSAAEFAAYVQKECFLYKEIWRKNTTLLLRGPKAVDKVSQALDIIARCASRGEGAIYVNTAHDLIKHCEQLERLPEMLVFAPQFESIEDRRDYSDLVIEGIEEAVAATSARIFIIDSVTRIAALSFGRNASAAYVMKRLVSLQVRLGISLLVISHDSTASVDRTLAILADTELSLSADLPLPSKKSKSGKPRFQFMSAAEYVAQLEEQETESEPDHVWL